VSDEAAKGPSEDAGRPGTAQVRTGGPRISAEALGRELPKKFYETAGVTPAEGGFHVTLDGRPLRTPRKAKLIVASEVLAEAIAGEWTALDETIDPARLPLTKIANTVIDGVVGAEREIHDDIIRFIGNDLLFYRAGSPQGLDARQAAHWDPVLDWVAETYGARFRLTEGVMPVEQNLVAVAKAASALSGADAMVLAPVHVITTLTGSALLAIALKEGRLSTDEVWTAAHVDEAWQEEQWGADTEAAARQAKRRAEFEAAVLFLSLADAGPQG
jgi:chaperone required for assembly of F1-ATPase